MTSGKGQIFLNTSVTFDFCTSVTSVKIYIKLRITITEKEIIKIQTDNKDTSEGSLQSNKVIAWVDL